MSSSESNDHPRFIEMTGKTLFRVLSDQCPTPTELAEVGVNDESIIRVNPQGDIEIRRPGRWDVIGGLLGDFEERIRRETGLDWS
jgi:hypothetical protein